MNSLTLSGLKLGLSDLLEKRRTALERSSSGKTYAPMLENKLALISALPPAILGGKPLAAELDETDAEHDGFGGAVWYTTEAYLRLPGVSPAVADAAARIRAAFIPSLSDLKAAYVDEAKAAIARKKALKQLKADLQMFPVAEGGTLYEWVRSYVNAGERLHTLLSDRADAPAPTRAGAGGLRSSTIGLLNRLRAAIADEVAHDPKLPRDLDAQVFGYLDEIHAQRVATLARSRKPKKAEPETPEAGDTGATDA